MSFESIEDLLKVKFKDQELLKTSLTHRSYLNEHKNFLLPHNERMEFLGDAVLELVVTDYLYKHYPNPEGELTNYRSALVNHRILSEIAKRLGIEDHLLMSKGESRDTGRARQVILANAMESVIGAIYLDQGYDVASEFIYREILSELPDIVAKGAYIDSKSQLQEIVQERENVTPVYRVMGESGPDHEKVFEVGAFVNDKLIGKGIGRSKQDAEISAALESLKVMGIVD